MSRTCCFLVAVLILAACSESPDDEDSIAAGERMYRHGVLASGEPITALVAGDVPIVGTQFSCESCHGRSGMGAAEGDYVVPSVAAQFLFAESPQPARPAYDNDSLARLLREGVTPSGRVLSPQLMPRYQLTDADVDTLVAYLETLSPGDSPGVDDSTIRFAVIVTDEPDAAERGGVVAVVRQFADDINQQTRNDSERWDRGYTPESRLPTVFREWAIDEWVLSGAPSTWRAQLERYYADAPVFAVVGGLGESTWAPVSEFCESNKLPCLYPSTDLPYRGPEDFYTVYFSRGLLLEADLIATHLAESPPPGVVQVYCDTDLTPATTALHRELVEAGIPVESKAVDCGDPLPTIDDDVALVLWFDRAGLDAAGDVVSADRVYVSSTLLDRDPADINAVGDVYAAHPYRLPGAADPAFRRFEVWANARGIEVTMPRQQAEAWFATLVIRDAVKHMGRFRVREFALDMMDHAENLGAYLPGYPRPSFGPGQRFINKGGYILPVISGEPDASQATWIIP